jgi:hypothetical protein
MDVSSLAAAMVGAQVGRAQMSVAAKMIKMSTDSEAAIAQLIEASQQNLAKLAETGLGQNLDISV